MYPERTRNLWLATSASAGASRSVGMKSLDQRCMGVFSSCFRLELENPLFYRICLPLTLVRCLWLAPVRERYPGKRESLASRPPRDASFLSTPRSHPCITTTQPPP